jgi:hypothetical protein
MKQKSDKATFKEFFKKVTPGNVCFVFMCLGVLGFFGWIVGSVVYSVNRPEHLVRVSYTIYSNPVRNESGTYKIKGEDFVSSIYSQNGTVQLRVEDGHKNAGISTAKQSVIVYNGTNDVKVNKIEVIK